ncbi:chitinase [Streptomyces sp. NPDC007088]|uniref:chitinase n=1 Tax=Streptomyces sp. NPDC007088 TaxID=3364773 RepID=UPI0036929F96
MRRPSPPAPRRVLVAALLAALTTACAPPGREAARDRTDDTPRHRGVDWAPYVSAEEPGPLDGTADPSTYNLAFAVADGADCVPVWGGTEPVDDPAVRARIAKLRAGADVRVSFGGQAGSEPARVCEDAPSLAAAYTRALRAAGTRLADFDVEGGALRDRAANARRNEAVAGLQEKGTLGAVTYTLPVMPEGLDADALALLRGAHENGVRVTAVNLMVMSYGEAYTERSMAEYAERAARSAQRQLRAALDLSSTAAWRTLRLTPMPGVNDVTTETFTLADARRLRAFAVHNGLGGLSMWASFRDRPCPGPVVREEARERCSGVAQKPGDFARALAGHR